MSFLENRRIIPNIIGGVRFFSINLVVLLVDFDWASTWTTVTTHLVRLIRMYSQTPLNLNSKVHQNWLLLVQNPITNSLSYPLRRPYPHFGLILCTTSTISYEPQWWPWKFYNGQFYNGHISPLSKVFFLGFYYFYFNLITRFVRNTSLFSFAITSNS